MFCEAGVFSTAGVFGELFEALANISFDVKIIHLLGSTLISIYVIVRYEYGAQLISYYVAQ